MKAEDLLRQKAELNKKINTQFHQITELQKEVTRLSHENIELKELLKKSIPLVQQEVKENIETDEETIAKREIKKLKEISEKDITLTLEECKKLVEYVKIIQSKTKKTKETEAEKLPTEDLLKLIKNETI